MEFEGRRKEKYKAAGKFIEKMKRIQEKAKAALKKAQEKMKKFANRRRGGGIQSRGPGATKYKGLKMANEGKKIGEAD